jgi:hypothetical protein
VTEGIRQHVCPVGGEAGGARVRGGGGVVRQQPMGLPGVVIEGRENVEARHL